MEKQIIDIDQLLADTKELQDIRNIKLIEVDIDSMLEVI